MPGEIAKHSDPGGRIRLRIDVDKQDPLIESGKGSSEVYGGGGLSNAPFLICDG